MTVELLVAVPRPLRTLFNYAQNQHSPAIIGARVWVPLGHTRSIGVVVDQVPAQARSAANYAVKPLQAVIDHEPLLDEHLLKLLQWAAAYYHHPVGEVIFSALPVALRDGNLLPTVKYWRALPNKHDPQQSALKQLKRAKRQMQLHKYLLSAPPTGYTETEIRQMMGNNWQEYLRGLFEKGLVESLEAPKGAFQPTPPPKLTLPLTADQMACLAQCRLWCSAPSPTPILLQGVTGSGKTEIYLRLIAEQLAQGKQTLVLVPEIGLTPQLMQRFSDYFPQQQVVCLHSGMNDTERLQAWLLARRQQAGIIIGTRSAVFTPAPSLGLIIVDEEHDNSLKQQEGFRYHARDLAIKRAQLLNIPILLGSATPALESLQNVQQGRYQHYLLNARPGGSQAPRIEVQDIRGHPLNCGLSQQTLIAIKQTLSQQQQVMLFINRRGFAPVMLCPSCGWQAECPSCSAKMTYHARRARLICHYCSHEQPTPTHCPACEYPQLATQGQGTERIELMLQQQFPETPVVRVDRDTTSRKGALQKQLNLIKQHERLLLVGTQMLAKGHDFPKLTLVVILNVDQSLLSPEYHALERFGQLITQVAGRAGRREQAGTVILQTTQPHHPMLLTLLGSGYSAFALQLLHERQRWHFPPFSYQALIRADALTIEQALAALQAMHQLLEEEFGLQLGLQLLGPTPAPMEKRAGRYRAQLLIQCSRRDIRRACLNILTSRQKKLRNQKAIRWSIDVDPVELA